MIRVLIVDDDLINRSLLKTLVEDDYNCSIDIAVNGQEAIESVQLLLEKKMVYDIIFLDIRMPVMDGHEALIGIRESEAKAGFALGDGSKVAMVTAFKDKENVISSFHEGCEFYLPKPFQHNDVIGLMEKIGIKQDKNS